MDGHVKCSLENGKNLVQRLIIEYQNAPTPRCVCIGLDVIFHYKTFLLFHEDGPLIRCKRYVFIDISFNGNFSVNERRFDAAVFRITLDVERRAEHAYLHIMDVNNEGTRWVRFYVKEGFTLKVYFTGIAAHEVARVLHPGVSIEPNLR